MNKSLLKAQMAYFEDTITGLAGSLGITRQALASKINGRTEFNRSEILGIAKKYALTSEQVMNIFFTD